MSKKSKRNLVRRRQLVALRAELMLTLENELLPHHLQYNGRATARLINEFREFGAVPLWAQGYVKYSRNDWADAMVYGQSITKMVLPST